MDLNNDDFLAGAVAAGSGCLEVETLARGDMESVGYNWYRICNPETDECMVVLMGDDGDEKNQTISSRESCEAGNNADCTRAFIRTLNFGGVEEDLGSLLCILDDGWVNSKYIDGHVLRAALEKGSVKINANFNFVDWAQDHGFGTTPEIKRER